ncbi:sugar transferase [Acaryochloris sp. IP29b_bin.148]|uniref:sugar transferase n=1 Tax=Acaryochloris sp. IP29b_bin.148 TaxID=2969218 RepID=UPI0034539FCF
MPPPANTVVKLPHQIEQFVGDIRAPHKLRFSKGLIGRWPRIAVLLISDFAALGISWEIAARFNEFYAPIPERLIWWYWLGLPSLFWVFSGLMMVVFACGGLYNTSGAWKHYVRAGQLVSLSYLWSLVISYFYDPKLDAPRSLFFTAWFSSIIMVIGLRLITTLVLEQIGLFHRSKIPVFIIAPAERLPVLAQVIKQQSQYRIVGAALSSTANANSMMQLICKTPAIEVLAEGLPPTELASMLYWQLRREGITLRLLPSSVEMLHRRGIPDMFAHIPTLRTEAPLLGGLDYQVKRLIDIAAALGLLILLIPVFVGVAIAIKLTAPGPVFFCQERVGLGGNIFQMWKFRTMVTNAEALQVQLESQNQNQDGILFKVKDDPRLTQIGKFLRRTSMDELPQLINVFWGQMSLVGPRPLPIRDVERFDSWHHIRHHVVPGMTGLWQISGRSKVGNFNEAARLDLYYIDNWSLNLDLEILVETARIVLFGYGAY